jgi:hypothetical protein
MRFHSDLQRAFAKKGGRRTQAIADLIDKYPSRKREILAVLNTINLLELSSPRDINIRIEKIALLLENLPTLLSDLKYLFGVNMSLKIKREIHLHNLIETFLRPQYPDLIHKPKVAGIRSGREPDTGIPSLNLLIEYKYMRRRSEYEKIKKAIAEDITLYRKPPWHDLFFVVYETENFFGQSVWQAEFLHLTGVRIFCLTVK